jgi:hypothetical protein
MLRLTILIAAICCDHAQSGQAPTQPAERAVELLSVTFAAVAANGQIVPDLRPEDVSIRIDGRVRDVRSLQLVSIAGVPRAGGPSLPPPFGSNGVTAAARQVVLVVDDESFAAGGEQPLRNAVARLLESLHSNDRVALLTIPHGGVRVDATTDRTRIRTAVASVVGRGAAAPSGSDLACRTRDTLQALAAYLRSLPARDAPSIVALMSAGLAAPRRDANISSAPGRCELTLDAFRDAGAAAGAVRAHFYIVPPVDILSIGTVQRENIAGAGGAGSDNPLEGIEQLLGTTGGKLLNLGAPGDTAFDRIVAENAAYYVAAIAPQRTDRGRPHGLEIRVARNGVEVRGGRTITFPETGAGATRPSAASPREMLSTLDEFRDLPLRAAAYPSFEEANGHIRVLALAEPVDPQARFSALTAALFDRDGKAAGGWVAQASDLERPFVLGAIDAPPGAYRLRVAAIDAAGRGGTADYDVDVSLAQTGTLKISAILLGLSRGGTFVPHLQFAAEPVVIGYVEMAGAPAGARVAATLELADSTNGPARLSVPLTIEAGASGRYVGRGALPIGALPPADYAVRAVIALDGHPPTRVVRTLRKVKP